MSWKDWERYREVSPADLTLEQIEAALSAYSEDRSPGSIKLYKGDAEDIGRMLAEAKGRLKHGEFKAWCRRVMPGFSYETLNRYRKAAEKGWKAYQLSTGRGLEKFDESDPKTQEYLGRAFEPVGNSLTKAATKLMSDTGMSRDEAVKWVMTMAARWAELSTKKSD